MKHRPSKWRAENLRRYWQRKQELARQEWLAFKQRSDERARKRQPDPGTETS